MNEACVLGDPEDTIDHYSNDPPINEDFKAVSWGAMTSFIKDEVEPWFEWATTDGPCKDSYTEDDMTAKAGLASVLETYDVWVGHIDSDGNACGEGIAIKLENGRKFKGTFWKNQPYGIVTVDDNNGQYGVYEFAYGGDSAGFKRHGKAI